MRHTLQKAAKKLQALNKKDEKHLDALAEKYHNAFFETFDCLDCANCCKKLPPIVNETDMKRIAKNLKVRIKDFAFAYVIADEDDDLVLHPTPCPFLEKDNKCSIYEVRPKSCRAYPHIQDGFFKNRKLHGANALYCPAVVYVLEKIM